MDAHVVAAEPPRPLTFVEEVHGWLRIHAQTEHHSLLRDRFVQEIVRFVKADRRVERLLRPAHAGDVIEVRVREQDVPDREAALFHRLQQQLDLVARVDDDAFTRFLAAENEAVLGERGDRAHVENHRSIRPAPAGAGTASEGTCRVTTRVL